MTDVIPAPRAVEGPMRCGVMFEADTTLWAAPGTGTVERWLRAALGAALGLPLPPGPQDARNAVRLLLDDTLEPEAYKLSAVVNWGVEIRGGSAAGVFWGAQTLRQLLGPDAFRRAPVRPGTTYGIPSQIIEDAPDSAGADSCSTSPGTSCPRTASCAISTCWPPTNSTSSTSTSPTTKAGVSRSSATRS